MGKRRTQCRAVAIRVAVAAALLGAGGALAAPGDRLYVQAETRAHAKATSLSTPVTSLEAGAEVVELARWASWIRVRFGPGESDTGWVVEQKLAGQPPEREPADVSPSGPQGFVLKVSADHTMQVRVNCDVLDGEGGLSDRDFRGETPASFRFPGARAVSCELRDREHVDSEGLQARLLQGERALAFARTDAIYVRSVRVRSDGPWGRARGEACRVRALIGTLSGGGTRFAIDCREP